jgi:hypothetical protein
MTELANASKLFTRKFILSVLWDRFPQHKIIKQEIFFSLAPWVREGDSWETLGERIFSQMKKEYRNEYVLKSELLSEYQGYQTLNEIIVGESRTDFIVPHWRGLTVYEIKSEKDSLIRLEKQLLDYVPIFQHVRVLVEADTKHYHKLNRLLHSNPLFKRVGINLTSDRAYRLSKQTPLEELDFDKIWSTLLAVEMKRGK